MTLGRWPRSRVVTTLSALSGKVHLVAKGYVKRPDIDYEEAFAPVARLESMRLLLGIVVHYGWGAYGHQIGVLKRGVSGGGLRPVAPRTHRR